MLNARNRAILKILQFIGLIVLGHYLTQWFIEQLSIEIKPSNQSTVHRIIMMSMFTYAILMSIPFVPGAEIGLAALMILGPKIAIFVYLAALSLSFVVGRFIPGRILINFFHGPSEAPLAPANIAWLCTILILDFLSILDDEGRTNRTEGLLPDHSRARVAAINPGIAVFCRAHVHDNRQLGIHPGDDDLRYLYYLVSVLETVHRRNPLETRGRDLGHVYFHYLVNLQLRWHR